MRYRWVSGALALTLLLGCGLVSSGNPARSQLETAMRRWANAGYASYEYRLRRLCFCPPELTHTLLIRVEAGQVTSVFDLTDQVEVPADSRALTVPALFEIIRQAIGRPAFRLAAEYHPELGYPTAVGIDYEANAIDDEITYLASELVQVP